jgi:hypothetical protein
MAKKIIKIKTKENRITVKDVTQKDGSVVRYLMIGALINPIAGGMR